MKQIGKTLPKARVIDAAGIAVCIVLSAAMFAIGANPLLAQRAENRDRRVELASRQAEANDLTLVMRETRNQLSATDQAVADHPLRLDPLDHLNRRLAEITELATDCELEIEKIDPGKRVNNKHYVTVSIRMAGRGSFRASSQFLHRLHRTLPDTAVAALNLTGKPGQAAAIPSFQFDLLWYAAPRSRAAAAR